MPVKKRGRPRKTFDLNEAEKLGGLQCTIEECAAWFGVHASTLGRRDDFMQAYKKGQERGKISLRRIQFKLAQKNAGMAIWLGKQYLDQTDVKEIKVQDLNNQLVEVAKILERGNGEHRSK